MSFAFQIAGSGYAANYAHIAQRLPKVYTVVQIVGRGSLRSKVLAEQSKALFSNQPIAGLPIVIAVSPDQQLNILRRSDGPILVEPELHPNTFAEVTHSKNRILVANHWASFPAVKIFVRAYLEEFQNWNVRQLEVECSERVLFSLGSIFSSLWPSDEIRMELNRFGVVQTAATKLVGLSVDYFAGTVNDKSLVLKVLRRTSMIDNGADSPQIFSISITTDAGILKLVSPFGPVVTNYYLGSVGRSDKYVSTSLEHTSMTQLVELRVKTNYLILEAFRAFADEPELERNSPYLMSEKGIMAGFKLAALVASAENLQ